MNLFSQLKECSRCKTSKPVSEFYKRKKHIDGLDYYCKSCYSLMYLNNKEALQISGALYYQNNKERIKIRDRGNREKLRTKLKLYYQANKQTYKIKLLKSRYGLTLDDFNLMVKAQKNKCKICKQEFSLPKNINIDHCHKIGKVRGLLCSRCNTSLGQLKESVITLKNMIKYIQNSSPMQHKIKL